MKNMDIKIIEDINEARRIWKKLSPNKVLYDNWDFRYCFYKYFNYPLYFYTGYDNGEIVGLLPLQFNERDKHLEFFGGGFMRDNRVFIKNGYKECIPQFYNLISLPANMHSIVGEDIFTKSFEIYKYKYIANLLNIKNFDDYLAKCFSKGSRNKMRKKIKTIELLNPQIIENDFADMDLLIDINKNNFGEASSFNRPHRIKIFHDLLKLNFDVYMQTFIIKGKKEAVSFSIKYKDTYVYIQAGTNKEALLSETFK